MYTTYYSTRYAQHVEHLILVSPAGVGVPPFTPDEIAWPIKVAAALFVTPMVRLRDWRFGPVVGSV